MKNSARGYLPRDKDILSHEHGRILTEEISNRVSQKQYAMLSELRYSDYSFLSGRN